MANLKLGEPFGLEHSLVDRIDWTLALERVIHDQQSDFIYAPHLGFIFRNAKQVLIDKLKSELKDGRYSPGVPLTIEVPKSFRMRVAVKQGRFGPSYSRPGSILLPLDRLMYQAIADQIAPVVEAASDKKRSFGTRLAEPNSPSMFVATRNSWSGLQKVLKDNAQSPLVRYVLKIDISNFFGSLNQHTLIDILADAGVGRPILDRLEHLLIHYTGERSSRGIIQGLNSSDLFGNFYMSPIDQFLDDHGVASARYVDDVYVFVDSVESADRLLRVLIPTLRSYDLVLNEAKSVLLPKNALQTEEPDLEALFHDATQEIAEQFKDEDLNVDYGLQSEWEDVESASPVQDLELAATKLLFGSIASFSGQEENIERFCLPLFKKAKSDFAVAHVLDAVKRRPAMTQIYASYLSQFIYKANIQTSIAEFIKDDVLVDWQKMWMFAALLKVKPKDSNPIQMALAIFRDAGRHETLRAVAAIYVGTYGDLGRRKILISLYAGLTPYLQAAIYFSTKDWPHNERAGARASWRSLTSLNSLLTSAMSAPKS